MKQSLSVLLPIACIAFAQSVAGAEYEWTFNSGTLSDAFGNGLLEPVGATVPAILDTNGTTIPHIGGVPAKVLSVPAFLSPLDGFNLSLNASPANGGGAYINEYTVLFDLYSPGAAGWQALFQTDPENTTSTNNDADWYIAPDGAVGIGGLGYSAVGVFQQEQWHRLAMTANLGSGRVTYYLDGIQVAQRNGGSLLDQRFSLYSNADAGPDVRLFNEGDTSGDYTHALYVNSIAFADRELNATEIAALGGPSAAGILVPEPAAGLIAMAGAVALATVRRRR